MTKIPVKVYEEQTNLEFLAPKFVKEYRVLVNKGKIYITYFVNI